MAAKWRRAPSFLKTILPLKGMAMTTNRRNAPIAFRLKDRPLFSLFSGDVPASAQMCLDCGFIELWGDAETARRVLKRDS